MPKGISIFDLPKKTTPLDTDVIYLADPQGGEDWTTTFGNLRAKLAADLDVPALNKYDATTAPGVDDDSTAGYAIGSVWYDLTAKEAYRCFDASEGAAVWEKVTLTPDELGALAFKDQAEIADVDGLQASLDELSESISAGDAVLIDVESPPESAVILHDEFLGNLTTYSHGNTRQANPGGGAITFSVNGGSIARVENGSLLISGIATTGGGTTSIYGASQSIAAGLTVMARFTPSAKPGAPAGQCGLGFSTNASMLDTRGMLKLNQAAPGDPDTLNFSNGAGGSQTCFRGFVVPGKPIGMAVKMVSETHQTYHVQGGRLENIAPYGSEHWVTIAETFMDLTGLIVVPVFGLQFKGTTLCHQFSMLSDWSPSERNHTLDFSSGAGLNGTHIMTIGKDPVTGLVIRAWNRGTSHVGAGKCEIRYSVRLPDGSKTAEADLIPDPVSPNGQSINSFAIRDGQLWLIYWKSPTGADGGTLFWRSVTLDAVTGAATLGAETLMGVSGTGNLNFSSIVHLPGGRMVLPYHKSSPANTSYISYSDDGGDTWTEVMIANNTGVEPTLAIESDGALVAYLRTGSGYTNYVRCVSPTDAGIATWTTAVPLHGIPQPNAVLGGARLQAMNHSELGILVIGCDHDQTRRNLTIWRMGDNGTILGKDPLYDWNPVLDTSGTSILQYPAFIQDGDYIEFGCSRQPTSDYAIAMQSHRIKWVSPVAREAGGTGKRTEGLNGANPRKLAEWTQIPYSTTPTPIRTFGRLQLIELTSSTATLQPPEGMAAGDEMTLIIHQGSGGSHTMAFHTDYKFGGITRTWETVAGESNIMVVCKNPLTGKIKVVSWN